jgi:hypothetical protein
VLVDYGKFPVPWSFHHWKEIMVKGFLSGPLLYQTSIGCAGNLHSN